MNVPSERRETDEQLNELLAAALAGDEASRGQIIESCRTYLLAIAQSNLDEQLRAKLGSSDIVQETCLKANAAFNQFRGQTYPELLAWLRQTLVNDLVDMRRRYRGAAVRNVARESPLDEGSGPGSPNMLVDPFLTPSSAADVQEQIEALRSALEQLTEEYRQVIIWRNWDHLSFAEIGQRLQRSEDAARKLWSRAVAKLADHLPD
jgi:RNA polymerase sigma-70 factor (ECF subfamily)